MRTAPLASANTHKMQTICAKYRVTRQNDCKACKCMYCSLKSQIANLDLSTKSAIDAGHCGQV